jgi:hypothetical protein
MVFVIVTVFALCFGWLSWQRHIVQERAQWKYAITSRGGSVSFYSSMAGRQSPLPWYRRLFGDEPVVWIHLYPGYSQTDRNIIESLFPEAVLRLEDFPPNTFKF